MTITALHRSFKHLMMEGQIKLVFYLCVAAQAQLRLADFQEFDGREGWLLGVCRRNEGDRASNVLATGCAMRRMTICTTYVISPVFAAAEVVVFFFAGVTGKTRLRGFF
jgi:hypothetical protein